MAKRFKQVRKLVQLRQEILKFPMYADSILKSAIAKSLPQLHKDVYYFAMISNGIITSAMVAKHWSMSQTQAATILQELYEFGLLERDLESGGNSRQYYYRMASKPEDEPYITF